ncbi:glutamate synthase central domain-containing protein, partial [Microcoleus anatoxicus]
TVYKIDGGPEGLKFAVDQLCLLAADSVRSGAKILILSDRVSKEEDPSTSLRVQKEPSDCVYPEPFDYAQDKRSRREQGTKKQEGEFSATGLSAECTYIPPFLAIGAVHHHLIQEGLRMQTSLVVDTAQ